MYGHKWTSAHGEGDEDGTWQKGLTGISLDQIGIGLTGCALRNDPWPPSLPEFRAMCEQGGDRYDPTDGAQVAVRLPRSRALPEPAEHREKRRGKGKQHLADIYQRMGWRRRALGADK